MIKHFLNPPNWFTSASIFCSIYALSLLMTAGAGADAELIAKACVLIVFGGVFDLLDGRVARMTNRFTEFGMQLDSIADIISFGVAPALLAWSWKLHELGAIGVAITFWYVLCAAFRLARFNVNAQVGNHLPGHTQGLSSTMSGGSLVTLVWVSNGYLQELVKPTTATVAFLVAALGFLMISSIPFRSFKDLRDSKVARRGLGVSLALCLGSAVVLDVSMLFAVGAVIYITWGLVEGPLVVLRLRRMGRRLPEDADDELEFATGELDFVSEEVEKV